MNKIKGVLTDIDGRTWEKEGIVGVLAIDDGESVEVDFTSATPQQIAKSLATMLLVARDHGIADAAIQLYERRKHE